MGGKPPRCAEPSLSCIIARKAQFNLFDTALHTRVNTPASPVTSERSPDSREIRISMSSNAVLPKSISDPLSKLPRFQPRKRAVGGASCLRNARSYGLVHPDHPVADRFVEWLFAGLYFSAVPIGQVCSDPGSAGMNALPPVALDGIRFFRAGL